MYVHASVRFCFGLLLTTVLTGYGQTCAYDKGDMYLLPVTCTWYGYTYDDDEDDDMTRCRIHRDAALREARESERERGGWEGKGENWHGGDEGGEISPVRRVFYC